MSSENDLKMIADAIARIGDGTEALNRALTSDVLRESPDVAAKLDAFLLRTGKSLLAVRDKLNRGAK